MAKLKLWLIALTAVSCFIMGTFASCDGKNKHQNSSEAIAEQVWQFSQTHPNGFTIDIRTLSEPTEGIAVAYAATQGSYSRKSLIHVVTHALNHDGYVGGWLDTESGLYYFDSTKLFPEDQLEEALQFARENDQIAVYIISTDEEISVEETKVAA